VLGLKGGATQDLYISSLLSLALPQAPLHLSECPLVTYNNKQINRKHCGYLQAVFLLIGILEALKHSSPKKKKKILWEQWGHCWE